MLLNHIQIGSDDRVLISSCGIYIFWKNKTYAGILVEYTIY